MSQISVGLIGCGGFGSVHAQRLSQMPECVITSLCDIIPERMSAVNERHSLDAALFADISELLDNARPDAVVIATPHALHFEQGMESLDAGCHVLMEKPMVINSSEARTIRDAAKNSGKIFVVGYNTPCTDPIAKTKSIVESGELGRLELVTGWLCQDWKRPTANSWRQEHALSGGGQMLDSGAHIFASLMHCVDRKVTHVQAMTENLGCEVEINGIATIQFENGPMATITIGGNSSNDGGALTFIFEDGRIEVDGWGGRYAKIYRRGENEPEEVNGGGNSSDSNFINSILGNETPVAGAELGMRLAELMGRIYQA